MYIVRLFVAAILAAVATTLLLLVMQLLIKQDELNLKTSESYKIADIQMGKTDIDVNVDVRKPEKPDTPEQEPPPAQEPTAITETSNLQAVNLSPSLRGDLSFGGPRLSASDGEYLPIVKVPPEYPRRALSRNLEGYCVVEFTVGKTGSVHDPRVIDCSSTLFEQSSLQAVLKFKYKPRIEDGEPIEVTGVKNIFTYKLSD